MKSTKRNKRLSNCQFFLGKLQFMNDGNFIFLGYTRREYRTVFVFRINSLQFHYVSGSAEIWIVSEVYLAKAK